jgi:DNA-binding transcriptional LysR family regulator
VELQDLDIFVHVAQEGSFSRAAAALHRAQPAVSARIAALESEVGERLFVRTHRGAVLTSAGEALLPYATRCLRLAAEGAEVARASGATIRLHVATVTTLAQYVLPQVLAALEGLPMQVYCPSGHSTEVRQMVLDGVAHAGFLLGGPVQSGLHLEVLHESPIVCVTGADHPLARAGRVAIDEIAKQRVAPYSRGSGFDDLIELLEAHGLPQRGPRSIGSAAAVRELVAHHGFVSFLPRMTVAADLRSGALVTVDVADLPRWAWSIALTYREGRESDRGLAALLPVIRQIKWPT